MVIDTSALIALIFDESSAGWIEEKLEKNRDRLLMSTVNLTESLIIIKDRQPNSFDVLREKVFATLIQFVSPTVQQAELAAQARLKFPLNLGDCFAYALAVDEGAPLLTLDRDFSKTDIKIAAP